MEDDRSMKKVLIYGDSNVWGDNFLTGTRIPDQNQWPIILEGLLGNHYKILQEGLPGRLAGNEEIEKKFKNGKESFLSTFRTNAPVEHIIIMLGTNDLQIKYNKSTNQIIQDLLWYYQIIFEEFQNEENQKKFFVNCLMPKFLFVLPANFDYIENAKLIFNKESEIKRQQIIKYFKENQENFDILELNNIPLFNDGLHLNFEGHQILAHEVERFFNHE